MNDTMDLLRQRYRAAAQRLRQFGRLTAGRMFGTMTPEDGRYQAVMGIEERGLFARAELNALVKLLVDKGVVTEADWTERVTAELAHLTETHEALWPELTVDAIGVHIHDVPAYMARANRERWPK